MGGFIKKLLLLVLGVFLVLQFIPVDRSNPESNQAEDFLVATKAPEQISSLMKSACYDCHSNTTVWPWYSYMAPASWVVSSHVEEGREELNFSIWETFDLKRKDHKLEECVEAITEGWMPERGYVKMHEEAVLTDEQRKVLAQFFTETRANL